jgi:hypothetical protein
MSTTPTPRAIATFRDEDRARRAVRHLRDRGVPAAAMRLDDPDDRATIGRLGQRREADTSFATPGMVGEERTMKAGWFHSLAWGAAGAVLGAIIGVLVDLDAMSEVAEVLTFAVVGALALSSAGFVFGLGRGPDVKPGPVSSARRTVLSVEHSPGGPEVVDLLRAEQPDGLFEAAGEELATTHDQRVGRIP